MVNYDDYSNLALSRLRAQKWLTELFKPKNFAAIMKSVDKGNPSWTEFQAATDINPPGAGLTEDEQKWLFAYLKHVKDSNYSAVPEAASSGW